MKFILLILVSVVLSGCPRKEKEIVAGEAGFLKGQLHLHSDNSRDGATPPADVVRWYAARKYDFIVFTDHERITTMPSTPSMLVIPGVELTQNLPVVRTSPGAGAIVSACMSTRCS